MKTYYYGGEALPRGLYVYRDRHVTIVDEHGEWCAYDILYPSPGVRSDWPGVSSSCARIRIRRALEVVRSTGKPLSHWQARRQGGIGGSIALSAAILLPDREALRARCDARLHGMIAAGGLDEVVAFIEKQGLLAT